MHFRGKLFRALNPVFAREPLSGEGAAIYGGRFNPRGTPALYASLTPMTALREANQAGAFQPVTLVSYECEIDHVFDGRDASALAVYGMDAAGLADNAWRDRMRADGEAFARQLFADGHNGLIVRSFAPGTGAADLNLVLWRWSGAPPTRLVLIDDEGRLS